MSILVTVVTNHWMQMKPNLTILRSVAEYKKKSNNEWGIRETKRQREDIWQAYTN